MFLFCQPQKMSCQSCCGPANIWGLTLFLTNSTNIHNLSLCMRVNKYQIKSGNYKRTYRSTRIWIQYIRTEDKYACGVFARIEAANEEKRTTSHASSRHVLIKTYIRKNSIALKLSRIKAHAIIHIRWRIHAATPLMWVHRNASDCN